MYFDIENVEIIAVGGNIRDIMRLQKQYGYGRWRKLKGITTVNLINNVLIICQEKPKLGDYTFIFKVIV